jgi:hypothetical protein
MTITLPGGEMAMGVPSSMMHITCIKDHSFTTCKAMAMGIILHKTHVTKVTSNNTKEQCKGTITRGFRWYLGINNTTNQQ